MSSFLSNKFLKYRGIGAPPTDESKPASTAKIEHDLACKGCGYNLRGLNFGRNCPECGKAIIDPDAPPPPPVATKQRMTSRIDHDLACFGCGYNVRGLNYGRNCPECGAEIMREEAADPLLSGDWSHRQRIALALMGLSLCVLYAMLARAALFFGLVFMGAYNLGKMYVWAGLAASIVWIVSVWIITQRHLHETGRAVTALIWISRLLSLLWIPAYMIWIRTLRIGSPWFAGPMASSTFAGVVLRGIASIGVLTLAVLLYRLAARSELEDATRRIGLSFWVLPISTLLLAATPTSVLWVFLLLIIVILVFWCWSAWLLGRGLWAMAQHVRWSMRLTEERTMRAHRQAEIRKEMDAEVSARVRSMPASLPDLPFDDESKRESHSMRR